MRIQIRAPNVGCFSRILEISVAQRRDVCPRAGAQARIRAACDGTARNLRRRHACLDSMRRSVAKIAAVRRLEAQKSDPRHTCKPASSCSPTLSCHTRRTPRAQPRGNGSGRNRRPARARSSPKDHPSKLPLQPPRRGHRPPRTVPGTEPAKVSPQPRAHALPAAGTAQPLGPSQSGGAHMSGR